MNEEITYMNKDNMCICCFKKPEKRAGHIKINGLAPMLKIPLQKHHVTYFPQLIAWVHDHCHTEINEGKYPHLVQYKSGESREFYGKQT